MTTALYLVGYASLATFVVALAVRAYRIMSMPVHLRWELYPVAHEGRRARYGGSYFEDLDWWNRPRRKSLVGELRGMLPEMIFLKGLWEHNRALWFRSFPFHFGLYLLAAWGGLLGAGAIASLLGLPVGPDAALPGRALFYLPIPCGVAGLVLATAGTLALLHRRLTDPELTGYTAPAHVVNLAFFLVVLLAAILAFALADPSFALARGYLTNLIAFRLDAPAGGTLIGIEMLLFALLIAYIPLTHMSHFMTKYFFYHHIRWDDAPNVKGSRMEQRILTALSYPVTWSAPHLGADGKKTWADIATETPAKDKP